MTQTLSAPSAAETTLPFRSDLVPQVRWLRPGAPFTSTELHAMTSEGLIRNIVWDVYAACDDADSPALRSKALCESLPLAFRGNSVLCGETAAWVYGGLPTPNRAMLVTQKLYRRPTASAMPHQIHQIPLQPHHWQYIGNTKVTAPLRTAVDLYCGVGTTGSRKDLCTLENSYYGRTGGINMEKRWRGICALLNLFPQEVTVETMITQIFEASRFHPITRIPRYQVGEHIAHGVSRRLPTVRYTS